MIWTFHNSQLNQLITSNFAKSLSLLYTLFTFIYSVLLIYKVLFIVFKLHQIPKKQKLVHLYIFFTIFIKTLINKTDKSFFFQSRPRHVKTATHWKPIQKFKLKLVNIFKSNSQHNHQVYFWEFFFCFISSKLYFIFTTQCSPYT